MGRAMQKSVFSRDYKVFLQELIAARKRARLTQGDLAERIGQTQSFVSKCERGERRLDVIELRAICQAFNTSLITFVKALDKAL